MCPVETSQTWLSDWTELNWTELKLTIRNGQQSSSVWLEVISNRNPDLHEERWVPGKLKLRITINYLLIILWVDVYMCVTYLKIFKVVLTKAKMMQIYSTCYMIWRSKIYEYRSTKDKHKWNYTTVRFGHCCQIV